MRGATFLGFCLFFLVIVPLSAGDWSLTVLPNAAVRYRGEGKVIPQSYVNHFAGETSPLYRIEYLQRADPKGYWGLALWHTGEFGGGKFASEQVPDNSAGGNYQENLMNVGFTNVFVTYRRPLEDFPVEALASFSVVRQIFKRKEFIIQGTDLRASGFDDVNEISAEGVGFGLSGRHGDRFFARWQTSAHHYVQIFDAKTDSHAGQIFQAEAGFGARVRRDISVEAGGLWQYWFTHGQGNRRIEAPNGSAAVISWNRQETRASGLYLRFEYRFSEKTREDN